MTILPVFVTVSTALSLTQEMFLLNSKECHVANFFHGNQEHKTTYGEIIEQHNLNGIPHSFTKPQMWGQRHSFHDSISFPNFHLGRGCSSFLIIDPTPSQLLHSIQRSGYFIEPSTIFLAYITTEAMPSDHRKPNSDLLFSDVTLIFFLRRTVLVFCYFCSQNLVGLLPDGKTLNNPST